MPFYVHTVEGGFHFFLFWFFFEVLRSVFSNLMTDSESVKNLEASKIVAMEYARLLKLSFFFVLVFFEVPRKVFSILTTDSESVINLEASKIVAMEYACLLKLCFFFIMFSFTVFSFFSYTFSFLQVSGIWEKYREFLRLNTGCGRAFLRA